MSSVHTIEDIYKFPIIAKEEKKGVYSVRLHDGRVSDMYEDVLDREIYIKFQKQLIESFISKISSFEDWIVCDISYDSMKLCKISIPALIIEPEFIESTRERKFNPKYTYEKKIKFSPIDSFPFSSRASLCKYFDNLIVSDMISYENDLGPRKWIVSFHKKNVYFHLKKLLGSYPSLDDIISFKNIKRKEIIEKMSESCSTAKWTLFETDHKDLDIIIGFYQY